MLKIIGIILGVVAAVALLIVFFYGLSVLITPEKPQAKRLFKRFMVVFGIIIVVLAVLGGIKGLQIHLMLKKFANQKQQTYVSDEAARLEHWPPYVTAVGNLTAVQGVEVSNQLAGNVTGIYFQSGTRVRKGQLLVQLDDSSQQAQLIGLKAQVQLAQINYQRDLELIKEHLIAKSDLDTAENNLKQAQSSLKNVQSAINKLAIRAPFSGEIGIRNVNLGQYLADGTSIATLQSLDTLYVQFGLPEQDLAVLAKGQHVEVSVDAYPGKVFNGELSAINSAVDPNTHNITLQATIHNTGHLLRSGMFANVHVFTGKSQTVVTVPTSAVDYTLYGSSVYIVKESGKDTKGKSILKVTQQFVTTGQERDGRVAITKGLQAGDIVVTAGQQKLQNGMQVEINNSINVN